MPKKPKKNHAPGPPQKAEAVYYIGPNLPTFALRQNQSFRNGVLPQNIRALLEADPKMNVLFGPVSGLGEARKGLADKNSRYSKAFAHALRTYRAQDKKGA